MAAWLGGIVVRDAGRRGTTIAPPAPGSAPRHAPVPWILTAFALDALAIAAQALVGHDWAAGGAGLTWPWAAFAGLFMAARAVTTGWRARGTGWTATGAGHPGRAAAL